MPKSRARTVTVLLALSVPLSLFPAAHALCIDPAGECAAIPCEAEDSCESDADCAPGATCVPWDPSLPCIASICFCENGDWTCSDDCSDQCGTQVPAVSGRGPLVLALLLVAFSSLVILRRRLIQSS
jgi:hypothetical protein